MTDVELTTRHDSEFYARLPKATELSLCNINEAVNGAQVCRTCTRSPNRLWNSTRSEQMVHINQGGSLEDLMCKPTESWGSFRVLNQTDFRGRIVSLDTVAEVPTRAIVETCGQDVRRDCAACDRFEAINVEVAFTNSREGKVAFRTEERGGTYVTVPYTTDDSPVKTWKVVVGGRCSIPAEGIEIDGQIKHCDWQERKKRIESPSCANCYYLDYKGESWQFNHLEVNENAALTPWEREQVDPDEVWLELWRKQSGVGVFAALSSGRRYWFSARLLGKEERKGRIVYHIRFAGSNAEAKIWQDDERFLVHELDDPEQVAVDVAYPWNKKFRLHMPTKKNPLIWPKLPETVVIEDNAVQFVNPTCRECKPTKACYYHAKGPARSPIDGTINFYHPEGKTVKRQIPNHGMMRVVKRHDQIVAVDGNDHLPEAYSDEVANASVFRLWLPSLMETAEKRYGKPARMAIFKQFLDVMGSLARSPHSIQTKPLWLRNSTREPNKPYCSHPNGADLRKVFQDSFGSERVDWEFDHGAMTHDQVEEEWRVGYRQHSQTPQRLQEEIMASDASHPHYMPGPGVVPMIHPDYTGTGGEIVEIAAIGDMYHEDGTPVTSTREFYDALDNEVTIGHSGEAERRMSKRQQLFGYTMSTGYFGKRRGSEKTSIPAADPTFVVFEIDEPDPDQIDVSDAWHCVECNVDYDLSEIVNFFDPRCENCDAELYKNHTTRTTYNPRQGGGIGNAFAMDSPYTQSQKRLYSTLCSNWRLNTGFSQTIISLDDVHGPSAKTPAGAVKTHIDDPVKIITVGVLSEHYMNLNAEYNALLEEVLAAREAHMEEYPDTPHAELMRLYPTPQGTIYQKKAEGSLSKMGGV